MKLFGPGTDSGTFDYFTEQINGEEGASRSDYSPSEDDNVTVQGVAGGKGNIGYFGLSYATRTRTRSRSSRSTAATAASTPTTETVQDGSYTPLSRPLFIYPSDKALAAARGRRRSSKYYVDNYDTIAEQAKFVPMTDEQAQKSKDDAGQAGRQDVVGSSRSHRRQHRSRRAGGAPARCSRSQRYGEAVIRAAAAPVRAGLGRDHGRDPRRAAAADDRVLRRGRRRRLPHRHELGAAVQARRASACCRSSSARSPPRSGPAWSRCRSASARRSTCPSTRGDRTRRYLKPALEVLAGIPTVVYGYFALTFVTPLLGDIGPAGRGLQRALGRARDGSHDPAHRRLALRRRDDRRADGAARGRLRPRRLQASGLDPRGRAGGAVGNRRLVRARHLPRGRRDDDRRDRRRARSRPSASTPSRPVQTMTAYIAATGHRRRADREHRVQDDLRGRRDAVHRDLPDEPGQHPARAQVPRGVRVSAGSMGAPLGVDPRGGGGGLVDTSRKDRVKGALFKGAAAVQPRDRLRDPDRAAGRRRRRRPVAPELGLHHLVPVVDSRAAPASSRRSSAPST